MKLEGTYNFDAPLPVVWRALFDAEVLAKTLPGCEKLERDGDQFKGDINVKLGPVQGKFQGKVDIKDVAEPSRYTMVIDGRGPAGFVKATARIELSPEAAATRLAYDSDVQVGGRIASVGQRLLEASARAILKQSLEGLHEQVKALGAGAPSAGVEATAPSAAAGATEPSGEPARPSSEAAAPSSAGGGGATRRDTAAGASPSAATTAPDKAVPELGTPAMAAAAPTAPRAPSQAAFAFGVAKEVTKELVPVRTVLLVLGAAIVAWIIYGQLKGG